MLLSLDSLKGRTLDRDVYAPNGRFLIGKGTVVTDEHIDMLRSWGVVEGAVYGPSPSPHDDSKLHISADPSMALWKDGWAYRWLCRTMAETGRTAQSAPKGDSGKSDTIAYDDLVSLEPGLVSYAPILQEITKVIDSPLSSAARVADVVVQDSALSASLLKVVNSPLYGFPRTIKTVEQAVTIVGTNDLMSLAIQSSAISYFKGIDKNVMDMKMFWNNSISCALFARLLAFRRFRGGDSMFFVGGMLMNLGRLVMIRHMPKTFTLALLKASEGISMTEAETQVFGYNSSKVTQGLFDRWFLPPDLCRIVTERRLNPDSMDQEALIFSAAETLAAALGGGFAGDYFIPPLDDQVFETLGISENELNSLWEQFQIQKADIADAFLGGDGK